METKSGGNIRGHTLNYNGNEKLGQFLDYGMDSGVYEKNYLDASNRPFNVQDALVIIPTISITTDHANLFDPATGIYVNAFQHWERPASAENCRSIPTGVAFRHAIRE